MAQQDVPFDAYAVQTVRIMQQYGILLTTLDAAGKPNSMAIGWGTIGSIWSKPVFVVLVRPSRYTYGLLEQRGEFTVNVIPPDMQPIVEYCGTVSGRDRDKFADKGLTPLPAKTIATPNIAQAVVNYECKVVHRNDLLPAQLAEDIARSAYPQGDFHRVYFGQILHVQADADAAARLGAG